MGAAKVVEPVDMGAVFVEAFASAASREGSKAILGAALASVWRKQAENLNSVITTCNAMTDDGADDGDLVYGMAITEVERHATVLAIVVRAVEAWFDRFATGVDVPGGVTWSSDEDHDEVTGLFSRLDVDDVSRALFAVMAPDARW